jgi:nicotinate-nucleotide pyrophosphorylase (carboxylating)
MNLGDMLLVKNNHIDAHPGGIRGALAAVVVGKPFYMPWEVEVRSLDELAIALEYKPTIVMLDNFSDDLVHGAVKLINESSHKPLIEVSGGMTLERIQRLQGSGIDAISMGSLTTAAPNVDISMRISA